MRSTQSSTNIYFKVFFKMASRSSDPTFIVNPTIVKVKDRLRPIFKELPLIAKKEDSVGAFSRVLDGVMYVEDATTYIHCTLEDIGT